MRGKRFALAMMMACAGSAAIAAPLHAQAAPAETLEIDKQRIDAALAALTAAGRAAGTSALSWQDGRAVYFGADRHTAAEGKGVAVRVEPRGTRTFTKESRG